MCLKATSAVAYINKELITLVKSFIRTRHKGF
jgi:hypothetical protein